MKLRWIIGILLLPIIARAQNSGFPSLSEAASRALPAVVRIQSFFSDSMLSRWPHPRENNLRKSTAGSGDLIGSASGVIVSADGYIITNAHVIAGGDSLDVLLADRRSFRATLIGTDDIADLALLKIRAIALPFLEFCDPDSVKIGDPVLTVGNPLELTSTVTAGILSARYRPLDDNLTISTINSFLQTDAAINEGMSGSALVSSNGRLLGINSAIISPLEIFAGYSFAIPADLVRKAFHDLAAYGRVYHGSLEASLSDMDANQARRLNSSKITGVLIEKLLIPGAGFSAGLRQDDVIIALDQKPVNYAAQLREALAVHNPGDRVLLTIKRAGAAWDLPVVLTDNKERRNLSKLPAGPMKVVRH